LNFDSAVLTWYLVCVEAGHNLKLNVVLLLNMAYEFISN